MEAANVIKKCIGVQAAKALGASMFKPLLTEAHEPALSFRVDPNPKGITHVYVIRESTPSAKPSYRLQFLSCVGTTKTVISEVFGVFSLEINKTIAEHTDIKLL